jgi:hypothetical protein
MNADTLRTPDEWANDLGIHILDPDGWRGPNGRNFSDPIAADEFDRRVWMCTIRLDDWTLPLPKAVDLVAGGAS